ncbi:MAG: FAD:protein FMN transferase [Pseudomonadota bacterium]
MTRIGLARRRVLQIAAALPLVGLSPRAMAAAPVARWQGTALGAESQIVLSGLQAGEAAPVFAMVRDEIARLEGVFSLYLGQSQLSRLNETGVLQRPGAELLEVLSLSHAVWDASLGAFDPSVQPLWRARAMGHAPARRSGDFGDVRFSADAVTLRPGLALTLNGIAQGYITDRVAELLRRQGLTDLVVDAGEQRALGARPGGGGWRLGVAEPGGAVVARLSLTDRALATSSSLGTLLADGGGHILDGRSGVSAARWSTVSVTHDSAAVADALSTAGCCLTVEETERMLARFDGARLAYRA